MHFFAVAFLAMYRILSTPLSVFRISKPEIDGKDKINTVSNSTPAWHPLLLLLQLIVSLPWNLYMAVRVLTTASRVIFPLIWTELSF